MLGPHFCRLTLRLLWRDLGSGQLLVMLLAAVIAVASTVSVTLLVTRVNRMMEAESSAMLAGDLALSTRDPVPLEVIDAAHAAHLSTSLTTSLRSVVAKGEALQLVRLKAVDSAYPLRGDLQVADAPFAPVSRLHHGPPRGEVWADSRAFQVLELNVGDVLEIGAAQFRVSRLLVLEPDRGGDLFAFAPRVMMHLDDLGATELLVPGSRASYRLLLAGAIPAVDSFRASFTPAPGDTLLDPRSARPEMDNAFHQAERFLTLAAFVGVLLATVGIALAANVYSTHHESTVAIFRTLGLTAREVTWVLAGEIVLLAVLATVCGDAIAVAVHEALLASYLPAPVGAATSSRPPLPLLPLLHGAWVALCVLSGFALPALTRLTGLPVQAVFSRDRDSFKPQAGRGVPLMLLAIILIAPWHLGNTRLVAVAGGGMLLSGVAAAAAAWLLVTVLGRMRTRTGFNWRFGLANISRRARLSVLQSSAIGLGIAVVLLLGLVRDDLMTQWLDRLPPRAPNHFLINIQADQVDSVRQFLRDGLHQEIVLYPMIRGRLHAINDKITDPDRYDEPRARRLAEREFNLSSATIPKADNRIVAGRWWRTADKNEFSVETGIAETLGISLGDELSFSVAERLIRGTVTSLREVDWDNFEVNFFVTGTPSMFAGAPATYITSFYLDSGARSIMPALVRAFPSVTVIDVEALMRQVRQVMARVTGALTWVFGFALIAGVLVLAAAVQASQRERLLDVVLLKTLGAPRRFITTTMLLEFLVLGALAGVIGSAGASATGWLLAHYVLDLNYTPSGTVIIAGLLAGIVGVTLLGSVVVYQSQRHSVVEGLRAAG